MGGSIAGRGRDRWSGGLEVRAEVFNLLNRAKFSLPNRIVYWARADVETPLDNAGRNSATANTSRQIQFVLKLLFWIMGVGLRLPRIPRLNWQVFCNFVSVTVRSATGKPADRKQTHSPR